jgi:hypothetical protein
MVNAAHAPGSLTLTIHPIYSRFEAEHPLTLILNYLESPFSTESLNIECINIVNIPLK